MRLNIQKQPLLAILLSFLFTAAITYVQHHRVSGKAENIVRAISTISGPLVVPVFILLAYLAWTRAIRRELPIWRNGLGLSSIVLLSCIWVFALAVLLLGSIRPSLTTFFDLEWIATFLDTTLGAALLALALRGTPRIYLIAAALLMWATLQSEIYF